MFDAILYSGVNNVISAAFCVPGPLVLEQYFQFW